MGILFLSYLSLPNVYNNTEITEKLKDQLIEKFSLNFNFTENLEYNFFPRPNFTSKDSVIINDKDEVSNIKKITIFVSLKGLFSLKNININDVILENANFNLNDKNFNFFTKLLNGSFQNSSFKIKNSSVFYRNINEEVLFINKIINMKYYFDINSLQNYSVSKNELFNIPYSLEISNNKSKKKIFSKLNFNYLKMQIINEIDYSGDIKKGFANLILDKKKSYTSYELKNNSFELNFFDKLVDPEFLYIAEVNFKPFYSNLRGKSQKIDLSSLFDSNSLIGNFLKTEILNNKNINFQSKLNLKKIVNYENFEDIFFKINIKEGLIDFDNSKLDWRGLVNLQLSDSLIYVKNNELILDGNLKLVINNSKNVYKILLTPKKYREEIQNIILNFNYNFDKKKLNLNNIKVDGKVNMSVNNILKSLIFTNNKLQNNIYFKNMMNKAVKSYAG